MYAFTVYYRFNVTTLLILRKTKSHDTKICRRTEKFNRLSSQIESDPFWTVGLPNDNKFLVACLGKFFLSTKLKNSVAN